ncbi:helix-turn-helix domain-containing protein [Companilactobacillus nantensis]|uniref:helix-turn-helix domain-containing protein n=1 Tax=Companilactobacillus nantensis TaxID=305793 RepID=UPI000710CFFD|nr:helix-turn-helix domain-containing protein [Companilactobacillus nantensis]GEO63008.1 hypothetical protein LNA01_01910 [Companilactobacillus nantensis]
MNNVNIYQEFEDMMKRQDLNNADIAAVTGVSRSAVKDWRKARKIEDKRLFQIANAFDDERFSLAVVCYSYGYQAIFLNMLDRYRGDDLSLLIGTQKEDLDSDSAIKGLIEELSKKNPDKSIVKGYLKQIIETIGMMLSSVKKIATEQNIPVQQIF